MPWVLKCLKELEEDVHLIERKKQGQGRPDMIYVKNFAIEEVEEAVEKVSEVCNVNPNNTKNNNTNINYINPIPMSKRMCRIFIICELCQRDSNCRLVVRR